MLVEELDVFFADLPTVTVVIGESTLKGFLDESGKNVLMEGGLAGVSATDIVVLVQAAQLPSPLPNRTALTVGAQSMRLRDSQPFDDGAFKHLICETIS